MDNIIVENILIWFGHVKNRYASKLVRMVVKINLRGMRERERWQNKYIFKQIKRLLVCVCRKRKFRTRVTDSR